MSKPERTPPLDLTNHEVRAAGYDMYHKHDVCEVDIYNTVAREPRATIRYIYPLTNGSFSHRLHYEK